MIAPVLASLVVAAAPARDVRWAAEAATKVSPEVEKLYRHLHQHPELSLQEEKTAARLAAHLRDLGYEVTTGVGGHGVVGVLKNGKGPTVLVRTDLDALPVQEKTGLPFASKQVATDPNGKQVPVMHACGHDAHMSTWSGVAAVLARNKARWRGTVVMVGQPAEELGAGAEAMLKDGLFRRFPKPDYALAIHVTGDLPMGQVAGVPGFALANVDSVDITVYGKGGHGAYPHKTIDPVVIAAKIVVSLQTLVSRETDPNDQAVVSVGAFNAGTKHNIIPDEARLQLTVRSYEDEVRKRLLAGIERIAKAEAMAANAPKPPQVQFTEPLNATYNDPGLTARVLSAIERTLGKTAIGTYEPIMGAEDFGEYSRAGAKGLILWVGASDPKAYRKMKEGGPQVPMTHSPLFAPVPGTLEVATRALAVAAAEVLGAP